jgi:hypothetical protein
VRRTVELGQAGGRSVAELREREGAEGMRYYPKGGDEDDRGRLSSHPNQAVDEVRGASQGLWLHPVFTV